MQSLSFPSTLPQQRKAGWSVMLTSVSWYLLVFQQSAGIGLLILTAMLIGVRTFQRQTFSLYDLLPLSVALSACITSTSVHWSLWLLAWAWSLGSETLNRPLPSQFQFIAGLLRGLITPLTMRQQIDSDLSYGVKKSLSWMKIAIIPFIICGVFFGMYSVASPAFAEKSSSFTDWIVTQLGSLNFLAIVSLLTGSLVGGWLLLSPRVWPDRYQFSGYSPSITRKAGLPTFTGLTTGLRTEYKTAYVLLMMVNVLLICYHIIDIPWIWFSYDPDIATSAQHSQLVHEGTYVLIASILMSMGILLYTFRGNLNFISGSPILKTLSYAWIAQNALLVTSVAVRNYHYISFDGLTYKRIGVIIFLALTLFGLVSLAVKIHQNESLGKLLGKNVRLAFLMAIILTAMPWSRWITSYNLHHYQTSGRIDLPYLINLDGTNLDQLWGALEYSLHNHDPYQLERRTRRLVEQTKVEDWRSFSITTSSSRTKLADSPLPLDLHLD